MDPIILDFQTAVRECFDVTAEANRFHIQACGAEFDQDFTWVMFPWVKSLGKSPDILGNTIGNWLVDQNKIKSFQIVKGFLNFSLSDEQWHDRWISFQQRLSTSLKNNRLENENQFHGKKILIEYCSPNTNKPLHLGHIRNILLGWSLYKIHQFAGAHMETTQVINDRGVAICKSMLSWSKWSNLQTPQSSGIKPDHFVGEYYVLFEKKFQEEYQQWLSTEQATDIKISTYADLSTEEFKSKFKNEYFNKYSSLGKEISQMLLDWEANDSSVKQLWKQMNSWVYEGFQKTYDKLGVHFDYTYYESETYLLGKDIIQKGLENGVFYKAEDGSVWVNLEDVGLDKKILIRSNGTSLYITQDLGTAQQRDQKHQADRYIYVVGDEQDYHFKVLFETLKRLGEAFASKLYHLSYGMVDLPQGKMKSREGTVVDADDLIADVIREAKSSAEERGEIAVLPIEEQESIFTLIGLSALKYFILKVNPKKRMLFDPKEAVDMQGHTGPYIVNAYVRIQSILRKQEAPSVAPRIDLNVHEKSIMRLSMEFPNIIVDSASTLDPSHLGNYLYQLSKEFHKYYHDHSILHAPTEDVKLFRLYLCKWVGAILNKGMSCLGIEMPDRM